MKISQQIDILQEIIVDNFAGGEKIETMEQLGERGAV